MSCPQCGGDIPGEELGTSADVPCCCEAEERMSEPKPDALERLRDIHESCTFHEMSCCRNTVIACAEILEEAADISYYPEIQARAVDTLLEQASRLRSVLKEKP